MPLGEEEERNWLKSEAAGIVSSHTALCAFILLETWEWQVAENNNGAEVSFSVAELGTSCSAYFFFCFVYCASRGKETWLSMLHSVVHF